MLEIAYQPHPLYPPLLQRRGGGILKRGAKLLLDSPDNKRFSQGRILAHVPDNWGLVGGFDRLSGIEPAVTIYGSARLRADDKLHAQIERIARWLGNTGF